MKIIKLVCALLITAWVSSSQATVILDIENGNLLGAKNVLVDGTLYDVRFLDGTCITLFSGCNESSDFVFNTESKADLAAQALSTQVFTDTVGLFDSEPTLTAGCELPFRDICRIATPYQNLGSIVDAGLFDNTSPKYPNGFALGSFDISANFQLYNDYVYAVWSPSNVVSEPGTVILLSLGIVGLLVSRQRKQS